MPSSEALEAAPDLDFTTDARLEKASGHLAVGRQRPGGIRFGTIGARLLGPGLRVHRLFAGAAYDQLLPASRRSTSATASRATSAAELHDQRPGTATALH
jgi:hypothetical protein